MIKKIANQCATFDGKGKLTVDDLYSVIKVQVPFPFWLQYILFLQKRTCGTLNFSNCQVATFYFEYFQCKVDVTKTDVRKVVAGWTQRFTICILKTHYFLLLISRGIFGQKCCPLCYISDQDLREIYMSLLRGGCKKWIVTGYPVVFQIYRWTKTTRST